MLVSISGGTGFIGKLLVQRHLERGDEVRVLSRQTYPDHGNLKYFQGDLLDLSSNISEFIGNADVFYNCAAELKDKSIMHALHVEGVKRLVETASVSVDRWVQLSSVGAYGECRSGVINEFYPDCPAGEYEETKTESDHILMEKAANSSMGLVILRPSIVFGAEMKNQSLAHMVKMIQRGMYFNIGLSNAVVNYVHVSDVVKAMLLCASHEKSVDKTYILSQTITLHDMVCAICKGTNVKIPSLKIPESAALLIAKTFGKLPKFPLTESRFNALTSQACYSASAICNDLDYSFEEPLDLAFERYAASL